MNFEVDMPENHRNNIFKDKEKTNKNLLMFSGLKVLTER